jgi:hypothetical protein
MHEKISGTSGCHGAARAMSQSNCQEAVGFSRATVSTGTVNFG